MTTDETGLAAALARTNRPHLSNPTAIEAEAESWQWVADTALAWVAARLADPATVEAVRTAIFDAYRAARLAEHWDDAATAALAAVRGLLGGTGGEGA